MKNVNKNNLKILLTGLSIGGLIFGGIGVTAVTLTADQIKYTPSNEKFTAKNADEALNEIYKIAEYEIPADTYFYEDGTEGDSETIVRYRKVGEEYFVCDANGIVAEGTVATDISSKTLIEYSSTAAGNLNAGSAGYASNFLLLGDSSDNTAYYDIGFSEGSDQIVTGTLTQYFSHTSKTKSVTFSTGITGYTYGIAQINLSSVTTSLNDSGAAYGVNTTTSVNVSTGNITFSLNDPSNAIKGFNGTITCKYVFWN